MSTRTNKNINKPMLNNVELGVLDDQKSKHINKQMSNVVGEDEPVCLFIQKYNKLTSNTAITLIALVITILFSYDEKLKCSNSKGFLLQTI